MTRGSGRKLKHGKFHLNIVSVVKHWSRQRGSGVSTLANIQILTGEDLEQPAPAHSEQGVGLNDLQRSPPTSASWWYVGSEQAPCFKNHLLTSLMIVCSYLAALWYRVVLRPSSHRRETEALCCRSSSVASVADLPLANLPWSSSPPNAPG